MPALGALPNKLPWRFGRPGHGLQREGFAAGHLRARARRGSRWLPGMPAPEGLRFEPFRSFEDFGRTLGLSRGRRLHRPTRSSVLTGKDLHWLWSNAMSSEFPLLQSQASPAAWRVLCGLAFKSKRLTMKPAVTKACAGMAVSSADAEGPMCSLAYRLR